MSTQQAATSFILKLSDWLQPKAKNIWVAPVRKMISGGSAGWCAPSEIIDNVEKHFSGLLLLFSLRSIDDEGQVRQNAKNIWNAPLLRRCGIDQYREVGRVAFKTSSPIFECQPHGLIMGNVDCCSFLRNACDIFDNICVAHDEHEKNYDPTE